MLSSNIWATRRRRRRDESESNVLENFGSKYVRELVMRQGSPLSPSVSLAGPNSVPFPHDPGRLYVSRRWLNFDKFVVLNVDRLRVFN